MLSDVAAQQAQVDLDQTNYNRDVMLLRSGTVSQAIYDQAQSALESDKNKLESLRQQAQVQLARLAGNPDIPVTQHPQYLQAQAQVEEAQRELDHTTVVAPFAGHRHECALDCTRQVPRGLDDRLLSRRYRSRLGRRQPERDRIDLCAARTAGHGDGRHLSERGMARHRREHQPGRGAGVLAAAGAEHQRQLGEGRAARADARARRHQRQDSAAAARRHERRGRRRYRPCARLAAFPDRAVRSRLSGSRHGCAAHGRRRQSRGDHRLRDPRHADAGARHHDRQRRAALHAGQPFGEPGPDRLGAHLLHRRRRDHDAADRLSRRKIRAQAAVSCFHRRLHSRFDAVRHGAVRDADRAVPGPARRLWRGAGAAFAILAVHHLSQGTPRLRDGAVRRRRDGRSGARAGARRLADAELHLALCLLHQPADRHSRPPRHRPSFCRKPRETPAKNSTGSASAP